MDEKIKEDCLEPMLTLLTKRLLRASITRLFRITIPEPKNVRKDKSSVADWCAGRSYPI